MIAYMEADAAKCFAAAVKASPLIHPKSKTVAEMKTHILGRYDAASVVTRADLLRGGFTDAEIFEHYPQAIKQARATLRQRARRGTIKS